MGVNWTILLFFSVSFITTKAELSILDTEYINVEFSPFIYSNSVGQNGKGISSILETMINVVSKRFTKITVDDFFLPDSNQLMISKLVAVHNNKNPQKLELTLKFGSFHKADDILEKVEEISAIDGETVKAVIIKPGFSTNLTDITDYLTGLRARLNKLNIKLGISLRFSQCDPDFESNGYVLRRAKLPEETKMILNTVDFILFGLKEMDTAFSLRERTRKCAKAVSKLNKNVSVHLGPAWTVADERNSNSSFEFVNYWDNLAYWAEDRNLDVYIQSAFDNQINNGWFRLKDKGNFIGNESFVEKADDLTPDEYNKIKYKTKVITLWDSITDGDDVDESGSGKNQKNAQKSSGYRNAPVIGIAFLILGRICIILK